MKTSHQSKNSNYRTLEKYNSMFYEQNKQSLNPACACHIHLINNIYLHLFIFKLCI